MSEQQTNTPESAQQTSTASVTQVSSKAGKAGMAQWGWWAGGLGTGLFIAAVIVSFMGNKVGPAASSDMNEAVREAILANPEIIPEAINRLQEKEVEKLLASNREAIETPFAGAWDGAADGDVVLVEFFDFSCPFCRQASADVARLLAEDSKLKVVYRDMPVLGPESERYALAALAAAKQDKYPQFYEAVFSMAGALDQEKLIRAVRAASLDEAQVAEALQSKELQASIENNLALGRALGLTGTPSYIVGNRILSGAVGYEQLKEAIEAAREAR